MGVLCLFHFMRFMEAWRELKNLEENVLYFYSQGISAEELKEKSSRCQIVCDIRSLNENIRGNEKEFPEGISVVAVRGMEAFHYQEAERLFWDSDRKLDVDLLKWFIYGLAGSFFFWMLALFCCHIRKSGGPGWLLVIAFFTWLFFMKIVVFTDIGNFPVWHLPEKWSDMDGWHDLWEQALNQISYIIQWKDNALLSGYYEGVVQSMYHLRWVFVLSLVWYLMNDKG